MRPRQDIGVVFNHSLQHAKITVSVRPRIAGRKRRSHKDCEEDAWKFYRLAAEQVDTQEANLERILVTFADNFTLAKKPLNVISEKYIKL